MSCPAHSPEWKSNAAVIITGFKVQKIIQTADVASIEVTYNIAGDYDSANNFYQKADIERLNIMVLKTPFGWKLGSVSKPHISANVAYNETFDSNNKRIFKDLMTKQ